MVLEGIVAAEVVTPEDLQRVREVIHNFDDDDDEQLTQIVTRANVA